MADHTTTTVPVTHTVPLHGSGVWGHGSGVWGHGSYLGGGYGYPYGAGGWGGYGGGYGYPGNYRVTRCKDPESVLDTLADWMVPFNPERPLTSSQILRDQHYWGGWGHGLARSYVPQVRHAPAPVVHHSYVPPAPAPVLDVGE